MSAQRVAPRAALSIAAMCLLVPLLAGGEGACPETGSGDQDPLVVDAGEGGSVEVGLPFVLRANVTGGTGVFSVTWTPPQGATLSSTTTLQPVFTPTAAGEYTFTITVVDSSGASATDTVTVTATSTDGGGGDDGSGTGGPLSVDAGPDRGATVGAPIALQGFITGGVPPFTIEWTPASIGLVSATSLTPVFTPASIGAFTLTLRVTDGAGATATDTVIVTASATTALSSLTWAANFSGGGYRVFAVFTQPLDQTTAEDEGNYRVNDTEVEPTQATLLTDRVTVQLLFTGFPLSVNSSLDLSVLAGVRDAGGSPVSQTLDLVPLASNTDSTAPSIDATLWGVDFAGSYTVDLEFSESLDATSAQNVNSYRIRDGGNSAVASNATLNDDARTVTLLFERIALSAGDARLDVCIEPIRDINGNLLSASSSLTVSANPEDVKAPQIVTDGVRFRPNFKGGGTQIVVEYDEAMDRTTATTLTGYRLNGTTTNPTTAVLGDDGRTVTLVFAAAVAVTETLDVSVGNVVKDINGNALTALTAEPIAAASDDATFPGAPILTWLKGDVAVGYQLTAVFPEAMDEASVETVANWLIQGTTTKPTTIVLADDSRTATLSFTGPLNGSSQLVVSVDDSIEDVNGNALPETLVNVLAHSADTVGPTITVPAAWSANSATYVLTLTFSEPMDSLSTTSIESYTIVRVDTTNGNAVIAELDHPTAASLDAMGKILTLTFAATGQGFRAETTSTTPDRLRLANSIRDVNGRTTIAAVTPQVITANAESTAPTVVSTTWAVNQSPYQIVIVMSEVMDAASTVTAPSTTYRLGAGNVGASGAALSADGTTILVSWNNTTATFTAADQLDIAAVPRDINARAVGAVTDSAVAVNASDTQIPAIVSAVWASNNAGYSLTATFNEALDSGSVAAGSFSLTNAGFALSGAGAATLLPGGTQVQLSFSSAAGFARTATFRATFADATNLEDINGNPTVAAGTVVRSLSASRNTIDSDPPLVLGVAKSGATATITFDESLDAVSALSEFNYQLVDAMGVVIEPTAAEDGVVFADVNGTQVAVTFVTDPLVAGQFVRVSNGNSVADVNENFTLETDEVLP